MARKKRTSQILEKAARRAASISSIDPNLDLGNGLNMAAYSTMIETLRTKENAYNTALSNLDKLYSQMLQTESELRDMTEHMLLAVAVRYGKSSVEYSMAGGVPRKGRRKGRRRESPINEKQPSFLPNVDSNGNGKAVTTI